MKLIILAVIIVTVLFGVSLMRIANGLAHKISDPMEQVMKDIK